MEKHGLREFVQIIQNKVSIAAAIAVLKSKPSDVSPRRYAEEIQEKLFQTWIKNNETSVFEDKILELQQDKIFDEITDLLEPPASPADSSCASDSSDSSSDLQEDICQELARTGGVGLHSFSDLSSDSESDTSSAVNIKNSANFMQAMTQLKFAVKSSKTVPVDQVYSFLYDGLWKNKTKEAGDMALRKLTCSEDSGFGDSCPLVPQATSSVPSSVLRFLTHSYKTEALVRKCMNSLLNYSKSLLLTKPVESFKYWKGSILEHLFCIFNETSDNPICSESVTTFIINTLENIWISGEIDKLTVWEYQLKMLSELCCTSHICEEVINFIIIKMKLLSTKISEGNFYTSEKLTDIHLIEKSPFFINLLLASLKKWEETSKQATAPTDEKIDRNVTELWKKKWSEADDNNPTTNDKDETKNVQEWKFVCSKLVTSSMEQFPLLAFQMWEVCEILSLCQRDSLA